MPRARILYVHAFWTLEFVWLYAYKNWDLLNRFLWHWTLRNSEKITHTRTAPMTWDCSPVARVWWKHKLRIQVICSVTLCHSLISWCSEGTSYHLQVFRSPVGTQNMKNKWRYGTAIYTMAVQKVSGHFEYLENRSHGLDVPWQPVSSETPLTELVYCVTIAFTVTKWVDQLHNDNAPAYSTALGQALLAKHHNCQSP